MWIRQRFLTHLAREGSPSLFRSFPRFSELLHHFCSGQSRMWTDESDGRNYSGGLQPQTNKALDLCYTAEQRSLILQRLNTATESDLSRVKLMRGRKAANLVDYRSRHGAFRDLDSVLKVPLLKHKSALIIFNSILEPDTKRRKGKICLAKFIKPEVDRALLEGASSIVSIVCGTNKISWTHMDAAWTVLDWQQVECKRFMKGAYMASEYLEDISNVVSKFPSADLFVVEKPSFSPQSTSLYPVMLHLRTVEAMLFTLLSTPRGLDSPPRVVNMMRSAVGRHFGLMVGESRTSGAQTVRNMMMESVMKEDPCVVFPQDLLLKHNNSFQMSRNNRGEELCDALLQAVAFYQLLKE